MSDSLQARLAELDDLEDAQRRAERAAKKKLARRVRHNNTLVKLAHEAAFECHYGGHFVPLPQATRDHIVPKAFGGCGYLWNLVYSCGPCNHGHGHTYMKCDCSHCASARLRWELEEMTLEQILRIRPHNRLEVMMIREGARERHGHPAEVWEGVYMM